eukprot:6395984-Karenia_brevis.AAC.1
MMMIATLHTHGAIFVPCYTEERKREWDPGRSAPSLPRYVAKDRTKLKTQEDDPNQSSVKGLSFKCGNLAANLGPMQTLD